MWKFELWRASIQADPLKASVRAARRPRGMFEYVVEIYILRPVNTFRVWTMPEPTR
jgi:hypothetical protein